MTTIRTLWGVRLASGAGTGALLLLALCIAVDSTSAMRVCFSTGSSEVHEIEVNVYRQDLSTTPPTRTLVEDFVTIDDLQGALQVLLLSHRGLGADFLRQGIPYRVDCDSTGPVPMPPPPTSQSEVPATTEPAATTEAPTATETPTATAASTEAPTTMTEAPTTMETPTATAASTEAPTAASTEAPTTMTEAPTTMETPPATAASTEAPTTMTEAPTTTETPTATAASTETPTAASTEVPPTTMETPTATTASTEAPTATETPAATAASTEAPTATETPAATAASTEAPTATETPATAGTDVPATNIAPTFPATTTAAAPPMTPAPRVELPVSCQFSCICPSDFCAIDYACTRSCDVTCAAGYAVHALAGEYSATHTSSSTVRFYRDAMPKDSTTTGNAVCVKILPENGGPATYDVMAEFKSDRITSAVGVLACDAAYQLVNLSPGCSYTSAATAACDETILKGETRVWTGTCVRA